MAKNKLGFTNKMAVSLVSLLIIMVFMGYDLAKHSIQSEYLGALACYTCMTAPVGTALAAVLGAIVNKSKAENTSATGEGINYAKYMKEGREPTI